MEHEIDMLYRSASAAEKSTPKKNRCSYNVNPITINCTGKITAVDLPQSKTVKQDKVSFDYLKQLQVHYCWLVF